MNNTDNRRQRIKRSTAIPVALLLYLGVMSYIGWSDFASGKTTALFYFGVIGSTLAVIILLHFTLKKREKRHK